MMDHSAPAPDRPRYRLILAGAVVAAALLAAVLLHRDQPGGPAPQLSGSDPADGAHLGVVPATVTLVFSAEPERVHVVVEDAQSATVSAGETRVAGNRVTQAVSADHQGLYQLGYHAEFPDGSDLAGALRFTVGAASTGEAPPPPDAAAGHVHLQKDPLSLVLIVVDLVFTVVLAAVLVGRRRHRGGQGPSGGVPPPA
jgi:hypothetical protein